MPYDMENDELAAECDELRDEIDTIIDDIGEIIMGIADISPCNGCFETAKDGKCTEIYSGRILGFCFLNGNNKVICRRVADDKIEEFYIDIQ